MKRLRRLLGLSASDRCLLIKAFVLIGIIRLGLLALPFRVVLQFLETISQPAIKSGQSTSHASVRKIAWAVKVISRSMPGKVKCLARALTTQTLMNWQGHSCEFRIGVAKSNGGTLEAHAWVEYQGQVVIGNLQDLSRFIPLPSLKGVKL
jgi:Transglutaminase-like superfamily